MTATRRRARGTVPGDPAPAAVIDTNWFVAYLEGRASLPWIRLHSVVTRLEALSSPKLDAPAVRELDAFLSKGEEIPLSDAVVERAAALRREFGGRLPDAAIAAGAALYGVPLLAYDRGMLRYASVVALPALAEP